MSGRITLFRWIDSRIQVEGNFGLLLYESEETVPSVLMATSYGALFFAPISG